MLVLLGVTVIAIDFQQHAFNAVNILKPFKLLLMCQHLLIHSFTHKTSGL